MSNVKKEKPKQAKIRCGTCGNYEWQNIGDANWQVFIHNRHICSGCLDLENEKLFYIDKVWF